MGASATRPASSAPSGLAHDPATVKLLASTDVFLYRESSGAWESAVVALATSDDVLSRLIFFPFGPAAGLGYPEPDSISGTFVDARGDNEGGGAHAGRAVLVDCITGLLREERVLTLTLCEAASAVSAEPKTRFVSIAFPADDDAHYFEVSMHEYVYGPSSCYPPGLTLCLVRLFGRCCVNTCLEGLIDVRCLLLIWMVYIALSPIVIVVALCTPWPPKRRTAPPSDDTTYTTTNPAITGADRACDL